MSDEEKKADAPEATEEKKEESADAAEETKDVEVPAKFKSLVEEIEKMSVLDLSELVKILEEKFGVSSAAPMMMAGGAAAGGDAEGDAAEEKSAFDVELTSAGDSKINVIKAIREVTELGLKEAKDLTDGVPKIIKEGVPAAEAEEMKKKLEEAGGQVNLK
jgi:large subunit ribosomal protein L7/L12